MALPTADDPMIQIPDSIKKALFIASLLKAGVAGAGAGLALLGAADIAFAAAARDFLESVKPQVLINYAAVGGGALGVIFKVISVLR